MNESTMPLTRALKNCGLEGAASHLAALATGPIAHGAKPLTHVRHAEHHLRAWQRGETDRPYLELAIARLLLCALVLNYEVQR